MSSKVMFSILFTVAIVLVPVVGCDDMPRQSVSKTVVKSSVVASGRGGYDWVISRGVFDVATPTSFRFPSTIDKTKIDGELSSIPREFLGSDFQRLDGLNDASYRVLQRYFDSPKPVQKWALSTMGTGAKFNAIALDGDGKRAAVFDSKLLVIDAVSGVVLQEMPVPSSELKSLAFSWDGKELLVCDTTSVYRLDIQSSKTTAKWEAKADTILSIAWARETSNAAVLTSAETVVVLDDMLVPIAKRLVKNVTPTSLAMSPDGYEIIACSDLGIARWIANPDEEVKNPSSRESKENGVVFTSTHGFKLSKVQGNCGTFVGRWISENAVFSADRSMPVLSSKVASLNFIPEFIHAGTYDGQQDWLTAIGVRKEDQGNSQYFVQDLMLQTNGASAVQDLDVSKIYKAAFNRAGNRILVSTDSGLVVFERTERVDPRGEFLRAYALYLNGKSD
ncbi:MAG: WD40 repeat domain-containing protein, partial [Pirellula sp.]